MELRLPSLPEEDGRRVGNKFRSGKCEPGASGHQGKVGFRGISHRSKVIRTVATILGREWALVGNGDTIPGTRGGPVSDAFGGILNGRNQCLAIHLASGDLYMGTYPHSAPDYAQVMREPE